MDNTKELELRPIHYLGSKLRILECIKEIIDEIEPTKGKVVDLFSGSGTVSKYLSKERSVVAVDIQEYSRVICSALLNPIKFEVSITDFLRTSFNTIHSSNLIEATKKLVEFEEDLYNNPSEENIITICELVEDGSLIALENRLSKIKNVKIKEILNQTLKNLNDYNYLTTTEAMITRYFGGTYFSYKQAIELDIILNNIHNLPLEKKDTFLAILLSVASELVNTVGKQFAQPLKTLDSNGVPKKNIEKKILKDRKLNVKEFFIKWGKIYQDQTETCYENKVYKLDVNKALDIIDNDVKIVYADPPYTRYHYSRYYHVLETIALRDNPEVLKTKIKGEIGISRGIYRADRYQSVFSIKTQAKEAYKVLFEKISKRKIPLILSYSPFDSTKKTTPRICSIEELKEIAENYFNTVKIVTVGQFIHSKLNKSTYHLEASDEAEILIICK